MIKEGIWVNPDKIIRIKVYKGAMREGLIKI